MRKPTRFAVVLGAAILTASFALAQNPAGTRPPEFSSPEVSTERKITFRIHAPKAEAVRLSSSDIPKTGRGVEMKKADNGVWEVSLGPIAPGAYRYNLLSAHLPLISPNSA
jgi:enterochelin esterase family protein